MYQSHHAACRMQQRNIPPLVVDLLMEFGASEQAGDGTTKLFFDKPARRKLKVYAGALADLLEPHLDVYAVVAEDTKVITVGHRYDRIRRQ
jgi:hypothetical protein